MLCFRAMKAKHVTPILNVSDMALSPPTDVRTQSARFEWFAKWGWDEEESDARARRRERARAKAQILMGNLTRRLERRRSPDSSPGLPPPSTNARRGESLEDRNLKKQRRARRSAAATTAWNRRTLRRMRCGVRKASGPKAGSELQGRHG